MSSSPVVVPARTGRAFRVRRGAAVRIVNIHGSQVVDTWALRLPDLDEQLSMEHTRAVLQRLSPLVGDTLQSNARRPLLTLLADSSPGVHDTLIAACDPARYRQLGHAGSHENCHENFRTALEVLGYEVDQVPAPLNLFMNVRVSADGALSFEPPVSAPGDHVILRAEADLLLVVSACPQDLVPVNGELNRPREIEVEIIDAPSAAASNAAGARAPAGSRR
jgi:uncharacterized protein YcgI (DUF1989 family)